MIKVSVEDFQRLYKENTSNSFYMLSYPKRLQVHFILVLNDTSSFEEQLALESSTTAPYVLYNILTNQTIEQTQKVLKNVIEFYTIKTFEAFKYHVETERGIKNVTN